MTYAKLLTASCGYYEPVGNDATSRLSGCLGKPFTARAAPYYFEQWKKANLFEQLNARLNRLDHQQQQREPMPSVLCVDSQLVKLSPMICEFRGSDTNKRVNGLKRTLVVDTQERLWVADVGAANKADGALATPLVRSILWRCGERNQAYNVVFAKELEH